MNIYETIKKPILSLAPMEDVTDTVFRQIVGSIRRPDVFYTEFVNVEGLNSKGKEKVIHRLKYDISEKPIVAQLWGINPKNFFEASKMVKELGFDGVDINMGCSVKKVTEKQAGSGLIKEDKGRVREIIEAVKEGAQGLSVSVKTRLGWEEYEIEDWIKFLLERDLEVLTIHGRTARGKNSIKADWEMIYESVKLRNEMGVNTLIFGNGDIQSLSQAKEYTEKYKVDGIMIGRAVIENPWFFSGKEDISTLERYELLEKHLKIFKKEWQGIKNFEYLKKFFKAYISGFDGANETRQAFMKCKNEDEALELVKDLLSQI